MKPVNNEYASANAQQASKETKGKKEALDDKDVALFSKAMTMDLSEKEGMDIDAKIKHQLMEGEKEGDVIVNEHAKHSVLDMQKKTGNTDESLKASQGLVHHHKKGSEHQQDAKKDVMFLSTSGQEKASIKTSENDELSILLSKQDKNKNEHLADVKNQNMGTVILSNISSTSTVNSTKELVDLAKKLVDKIELSVSMLKDKSAVNITIDKGALKNTNVSVTLVNGELRVNVQHLAHQAAIVNQFSPLLMEALQKQSTEYKVLVNAATKKDEDDRISQKDDANDNQSNT